MEILALASVFVLIIVIGYVSFSLIFAGANIIEKLSTGYLLGIGVSTMCLFIANIFGLRFTLFNVYLVLTFVFGFLLICLLIKINLLKKNGFFDILKNDIYSLKIIPKAIKTSSFWEKALMLALLLVIVSSAMYNLYWPIADWDALTLYDFRGRVFAVSGYMDQALSIHRYYLGYPLLTSISHTMVYLTGFQNPHIFYSLNYYAFIVSFFCLVNKFANRTNSFIFTFLLATSTQIYNHSTLAYTNLPYTIYYSIGFIYLFFWFKTKK